MATTVNTNREQVQWASGVNLLAGIWLFISAFAVYDRGPMVTNNILCGIGVAALAAIRAFGAYDEDWLSWLNVVLGIWVFVSPWALVGAPGPGGLTHGMIINNCITGGVVVVLGFRSALASDEGPDRDPYLATATPS